MKPTALRQEEKTASIEIAQSPGSGRGPAATAARSLPSASRVGSRRRRTGQGPGTEEQGGGRDSGLLEEGRCPQGPGTHTLSGSIPGADEGREEPRAGGGGAGSKPFTALQG